MDSYLQDSVMFLAFSKPWKGFCFCFLWGFFFEGDEFFGG